MERPSTDDSAARTTAHQDARVPRLAIGLGLAAVLLAYGLSSLSILDDDAFVMGEVAQHVVDGKRLYLGIWDNKPPLAILTYALPQLFARGSYLGIQLLAGVFALVQAGLWLRLIPSESRWIRLGGAALLALLPLSSFYFAWFSSEDTSNLFIVVALICAYRCFDARRIDARDALAMGAALVLAFHARQTSAVFLVVCAFAIATTQDSLRRKIAGFSFLAAGAAIAWALVLALVLAVGDLQGYVYAVFVAPRKYAGSPAGAIDLFSAFRHDFTTLVILASVGFLLGVRKDRFFGLLVGGATLVAVLAPMRAHLHYWEQVIPGTVLLAHMASRQLVTSRRALWAAAMLPAFVLVNAGWTLLKCVTDRSTARGAAAAQAIESQARPGDRLFVGGSGAGVVYFFTRTEPANMYFWEFYLYGVHQVLPKPIDVVLSEYRENPPELLVLGNDILGSTRQPASPDDNAAVKLIRDWFSQRDYRALDLASAAPWHVYRLEKP